MTRDLDQPLVEQARELHDGSGYAWLYEFEVPTNPPTRLRVTNHDELIKFDTDSDGKEIEYRPFPISNGTIRSTAAGDLPAIQVQIDNTTREIGRKVDLHDGLTGQPILVRVVSLANLGSPTARIDWNGEISNVVVKQDVCAFDLGALNLAQARFPAWRYTSQSCRHPWGGQACGYIILDSPGDTVGTGFSTCPKSFAGCQERGADELARGVTVAHPKRMGVWRGLPRR